MKKTYSLKKKDIKKNWVLIDAQGVVLGRLAAHVASLLQGKHKPTYEPHLDCGDNVIIINAEKIILTGKKERKKVYYWHTNFPGGIKETTPARLREKGHSDRIVWYAVKGMLQKGPLARQWLRGLYIYQEDQHKHEAQQPILIDFKSKNKKNVCREKG